MHAVCCFWVFYMFLYIHQLLVWKIYEICVVTDSHQKRLRHDHFYYTFMNASVWLWHCYQFIYQWKHTNQQLYRKVYTYKYFMDLWSYLTVIIDGKMFASNACVHRNEYRRKFFSSQQCDTENMLTNKQFNDEEMCCSFHHILGYIFFVFLL